MEFGELGDEGGDVVAGVGAPGMAGDHDLLPRGEGGIDAASGVGQLLLEAGGVLRGLDALVAGKLTELVELVLDLEKRFFKREDVCSHDWTFYSTMVTSVPLGRMV